jgi:hypothetical protein
MKKMFIFFICVLSILLCSYTSCYEVKESTPDSDTSLDYLSSLENEKVFGFEVIIAINKQVFTEKEEIEVEVSIKNNNSFDVGIAYFILFTAIIPTATRYPVATEWPPEAYVRNFKAGDNIKRKDYLGGCFDIGVHEIKYKAEFYINWGEENQQKIEVLSNALQIEII